MNQAQEAIFLSLAIEFLTDRGYEVKLSAVSAKMVTVGAFRKSLPVELSPAGLWKRLNHERCPDFEADYGTTGRIKKLRPHAKLIAFCSQPVGKGGGGEKSRLSNVSFGDFHNDDGR